MMIMMMIMMLKTIKVMMMIKTTMMMMKTTMMMMMMMMMMIMMIGMMIIIIQNFIQRNGDVGEELRKFHLGEDRQVISIPCKKKSVKHFLLALYLAIGGCSL